MQRSMIQKALMFATVMLMPCSERPCQRASAQVAQVITVPNSSVKVNPFNKNGVELVRNPPRSSVNWEKAVSAAMNRRWFDGRKWRTGHIIDITTRDEETWIKANFAPELLHRCWIGAYRLKPTPRSPWKWTTGRPFVYADFSPGEPNNSKGNSTVIYFYRYPGKNIGWADTSSNSDAEGYLVEYED